MSINPLGAAAYNKTELLKPLNSQNISQKSADTQQAPAGAENAKRSELAEQIRAPRREEETSSALAIQSKLESGAFAEVMTPQEREALALIFEKYQDRLEQKASYSATGRESENARVGTRVDYRV